MNLGSPIDVLWFRLSKHPGDPEEVLGRLGRDTMLVTINRNGYWQCAFVIAEGGIEQVHASGLDAFKRRVAAGARFLANRVDELKSFDDVKLLSVEVDRLSSWCRPGVLCIGDAAHAMSPVGGVGINLAIQDAVATANLLAVKLKSGTLKDEDLARVQRRRLFPVKLVQPARSQRPAAALAGADHGPRRAARACMLARTRLKNRDRGHCALRWLT
ncbi:MAG: FAD-dependent monooxygenase [Steroidobacterales bacterium]